MSGWRETKLGCLGKVITGKTPSKDNPEDWGDAVLFVTPSDYKNYRKKANSSLRMLSVAGADRQKQRLLPAQSVLVTCIGSDMGKTVVNALPCVTNQQINAIIPNESVIDPDYLYYITKDLYSLLSSLGSDGTAVPILNKSDFENIDIVIPGLEEQKSIASVLSSLDDKIDLLHRQNKTIEAMAETLFRQWFVERCPEPVEGGEGESWREGTIDEIVSIKGGTTPSTKESEYWDGNIHWTSPRDLSNQESVFMFDTERKITAKGLAQIGSGLMPVGTVLMSSRAPIGYLAITDIPVAINQGYIAIICDRVASNYFMYLWCKANMEEIKNSGNGSVFEEISKSSFKALPINIPHVDVVDGFSNSVKPLFEKIRSNQLQAQGLERLRDGLLPKLMGGEIRVKTQRDVA